MEYSNVKNAHIVPRTYLEAWAKGGKIGVHLVREKRSLILPVENVGTRRRFYRRRRPDGTPIDDIEWSLGHGEAMATPVLRTFEEAWPLPLEERLKLAELFAYQLLRGPRWKEEHMVATREIVDEYGRQREQDITQEELERAKDLLTTDSARYMRMLAVGPTLTAVLGSMHWTLVEFSSPVVATSDHPVVLWPGAAARTPQPTPLRVGLLECIEIRLPLSPRHAVLMTWADKADDEETIVRGSRHHASNLNAFTVASVDEQRFNLPGASPPIGSGNFLPLSSELVKLYTPEAAASSARRARVWAEVQPKLGRELEDREMTVVTMSGPSGTS